MSHKIKLGLILIVISVFTISFFQPKAPTFLAIEGNTKIALVGGNLGSRMINYDHFETELHLRYPSFNLMVRNMCDGGDTPGFRPHSARMNPWAFPGAEKFQSEFANPSQSEGHLETHDQRMSRLKTDIIIGFFNSIIFLINSKLPSSPEPIFINGTFNFFSHKMAETEWGVNKKTIFFLLQ